MRKECWKEGYSEVLSPQMLSARIFEKSGHIAHYEADMFLWDHEGQRVGLKPMSCPCHCVMFNRGGAVSYKSLPIRLSEFGVVHRNECRGSLSGLRRVVRFCQDDAHTSARRSKWRPRCSACCGCSGACTASSASRRPSSLPRALPRRSATATTSCGSWPSARSARRSATLRATSGAWTRAAAPFTGRRSIAKCRTRRAAGCSSRRCSSTFRCRAASASSSSTPAGGAAPR
mmetsp:Transcript_39835/g.128072  ORF Transcript_39835/g.128072 Transcript_39835/m.128072 type:complete len:231 (+) Transcript_39835:322-1014(+)